MKHIPSVLATFLLMAVASPAFAQGGMGDGPGGPGGRGPSRGPDSPPGEGGKDPKKEEPKTEKPPIENMEIVLRFVPGDLKSCEGVEKALQKIPTVKRITVTPGEAKMTFTGSWEQLIVVQNTAAAAKVKAALIAPAIFTVDCAPARANPSALPAVALAKVTGVLKTVGEGSRVTVFGPAATVNPAHFTTALQEVGWRYVAIRSHRWRTLSYEPWEKGVRPESIKERLMKVPGVLRVDVDAGAQSLNVLLIRETAKDLDLVSAAEDVSITIFPGKAEEEEEPAPPPPPKK